MQSSEKKNVEIKQIINRTFIYVVDKLIDTKSA